MAKVKPVNDGQGEPGVQIVGCHVKLLHQKLRIKAAQTAIDQNPANRPRIRGLSPILTEKALSEIMKPQAIAALTTKYWGAGGVKLGVAFMENTVTELQNKILSHMNAWSTVANANVQFMLASLSNAEVRISRGPGGYYSYLGPDILHIPKGQQTMNLEGFVLKTPESEYKRVVRHETGHTLGFPHEHMRKDIVKLLDRDKTIAYFQKTQGWSPQEIEEQVLTSLDEASLMGTPVDVNSIMCYQLPGSITTDGQPIPGGLDIDPSDAAFAAKIYPKATAPGPDGNGGTNPPTMPLAGMVGVVVDLAGKKLTYSLPPSGWTAAQGK